MKSIYLDFAAATPLDPDVNKAMEHYMASNYYNPSAMYLAGRSVRHDLEQARASIAKALGSRPAEVIFTAGATEANNLAIQGVGKQYEGSEIIVSAIEHESVIAPAELYKCKKAPVNKQGIIEVKELEKLITDKTVLVSAGLVNNEIGTIQPLREIAELIKEVRSDRRKNRSNLPLYLHSDAAQAPCYLDVSVARLGVDLMSINGSKMYGPKQTGALYVKAGITLTPLILGGGQENGLRSGTENVANFIGLAEAITKAQILRAKESARVDSLKKMLINKLAKIASASLNSPQNHASPHIVNARFWGVDNERLMMELDEDGIQVAVGSACSASKQEPSHVLRAIGLTKSEAQTSLRISLGRQTTKNDIKALSLQLQKHTPNR